MQFQKLTGLFAATYTPLKSDGELNLEAVAAMVDFLLSQQLNGLYVCGSTGEGMSLSTAERKAVTREYCQAANKKVPVIAQVGHNCLSEACELARDAQQAGVDVISATCPSYFKIDNVDLLIDCMAPIAAAAPELPFYYYHIPVLTGSQIDMVEFLQKGSARIPNLVGLKYTATALHEYQQCKDLDQGRFDVLWGCDEMLLGALATGAQGAIGSTYNIAAPLNHALISAFEAGNLKEARRLQTLSIRMIRLLQNYPFHPAMKVVLGLLGQACGPCRLPLPQLSQADAASIEKELSQFDFFNWK